MPWAIGVALGEAFERARALAAEVERARVEQELEAERGAAGERRRIARELHDVLANSLSVMIVQASLAAELAGRRSRRRRSRPSARWSARAGPPSARRAGSSG